MINGQLVERYIGKQFLTFFCYTLLVVYFIIFIAEFYELHRIVNSYISGRYGIGDIMLGAFLKAQKTYLIAFPIFVLISSFLIFYKMNRYSELIVLRSSGFSMARIAKPVIVLSCFIGILQFTVLSPLSAYAFKKFNDYMPEIEGRKTSFMTSIKKTGLWVREKRDDGYFILNANSIKEKHEILRNVSVFEFDNQNTFQRRLKAPKARKVGNELILSKVKLKYKDSREETADQIKVPTEINLKEIKTSFNDVYTVSFWELREFIDLLEKAGFNSSQYWIAYYKHIASPLLLMVVAAIAICMAFSNPRESLRKGPLIIALIAGFVFYIISNVLTAQSLNGNIPYFVSAFLPVLLLVSFAYTYMINVEGE